MPDEKKIIESLNSKILSNQPVDKSNKIPRINLNFIIHSPGLGITLIIFGNKIHSRYGIANPTDIEKKILKIMSGEANIENPIAVPRNGALHGVAKRLEKTPLKNSPYFWLLAIKLSNLLFSERGKNNSKYPKRFKENKNMMNVIKIKKVLFWKWNPHPNWFPRDLKKMTINPKNKKENIIPRITFNDDNLIPLLFSFIIEEKDSNFIEITGRTQGIKFRISPPINAIK